MQAAWSRAWHTTEIFYRPKQAFGPNARMALHVLTGIYLLLVAAEYLLLWRRRAHFVDPSSATTRRSTGVQALTISQPSSTSNEISRKRTTTDRHDELYCSDHGTLVLFL